MNSELLNQTCQIVTRTTTAFEDDYGNMIPGETTVETVCELQQVRRSERDDHNDLSETLWNLFLPADSNLDSADYVVVAGIPYEVEGDPWEARDPIAQTVSHIEATVKRVSGALDWSGS